MTFVSKPSMKEWLRTQPLAFSYKLSRAAMHLDTLSMEIANFLKDNPCAVGHYVNTEGGFRKQWVWYADIDAYPPVLDWGCLIGDFAHNLRSALDNLVYTLAVANQRAAPHQTQFPIFKNKGVYARRAARSMQGISTQAEAVLESLQPYHRGQGVRNHPLWIIHELNNWDKHSIVNICAWAIRDPIFEIVGTTDDILIQSQSVIESGMPIEHGTPIAEVSFSIVRAGAKVDMHRDFPFDVAFFEAGPTAGGFVIPRLTELLEFVRDQVFGQLLPILESELRTWPTGYHPRPLIQ